MNIKLISISGESWKCQIRDQLCPENWGACIRFARGYCWGDGGNDNGSHDDDGDDDAGDDEEMN